MCSKKGAANRWQAGGSPPATRTLALTPLMSARSLPPLRHARLTEPADPTVLQELLARSS